MTDVELNELMKRAADGDREADEIIESWIERALQHEPGWLDNPGCCCRKPPQR